MDSIVLDAAAILAMLQDEQGGDGVLAAIEEAIVPVAISSVNFCEVVTKLVRDGLSIDEARFAVESLREYVVAFDESQALFAAALYPATSGIGLSLGDRACLALAAERMATAWTTDRAWKKLKLGIPIKLIRH